MRSINQKSAESLIKRYGKPGALQVASKKAANAVDQESRDQWYEIAAIVAAT